MPLAVARAKSETTPSKPATPKAAPVVHRTSGDSRRYGLSGRVIQPALRISAAHDPAEREAEQVAAQVARGGTGQGATGLQRSPLLVQRRGPDAAAGGTSGGGMASPVVEARVRAAATGGSPLVPALRKTLEPRFRADFGAVRLHTDAKAAALATAIGARAFTFGHHIFFNTGQYQPQTPEGMELLAHELTHTIQQQAVIQRALADAPTISERTAPEASRLGISDVLDFFADAANAIPGYRMFTILIGINPINMSAVEASAANILRAIVEFLPGGFIITRVLDSYGVFDRVGSWIEGQLKSLGITGAAIRAAINSFLDSLSWRDIFALGSVWNRAKAIFTTPITRILAFARSLFGEILRFVREAVLRPLAALAEGTAGYGLLKAVLGFDPVTGEAVPRTAETIIGGFMTMIGQQELWENIKRANAISRAWAWFQGALGGLLGLVRSIPDRFMAALRALEIMDFVLLPSAFLKLERVFGTFLLDFGRWALGTVLDLLRIIVEVVAPGVMPYLRRAAGAFNTIITNPVRFVQTLVRAAVQGFRGFASRFLDHLRASLIGWLTGSMAGTGVYIPQGFNLREILKFGLSVLGLTWANIRAKLVRATSETVVVALETGFDIVRTLVTEGPAAAWQKIVETLTNLKDMVIEQVMAFVQSRIVQAAVTKLLSMLSPAGALIQAIIAIYNTIMFFVERLRQIAQVAASFIDAIATIAAGNIAPAAARVEQTMAGLLTLVISFLARIAGLGRVSDAVKNIIDRIRAPIDRALDRVVDWIVAQARRLGRFVAQAGVPQDPQERLRLAVDAGTSAVNALSGSSIGQSLITPLLAPIRIRYGLRGLVPIQQEGAWWVEAEINPRSRGRTRKLATVDGQRPADLGALLEPILQRVEERWLAERASQESQSSRSRYSTAQQRVVGGGQGQRGTVRLPPLSREQEIRLLREIERGDTVITPASDRSPRMRAAARLTGGTETVGGIYINQPRDMGQSFIGGAGTYEGSIPRHVEAVRAQVGDSPSAEATTLTRLSPTRRRLSAVLEPARQPGMLVARRLGEELVVAGHATAAEVTHGDLATMAFVGAAGSARESPESVSERRRRLGTVIQRLRDAARSVQILTDPGGPALRRLGDAIENFLRANARTVGMEQQNDRLESAARRLIDAFLQFLRRQQPGR